MAGSAYTLAHALNKMPGVQAINLRSSNNYIDYPTIAEMRFYKEEQCHAMINRADAIVFHTAIRPYLSAFHLKPERLKEQKKLLYFHGTDCRNYGTQIVEQADEMFGKGNYHVLVSTPDLLKIVPFATWMPVARSFAELHKQFSLCNQDQTALKAFGGNIDKIVLAHAPTNPEIKGSALFFKIITELITEYKNAEFLPIQNMSHDQAMRAISRSDIFFDQNKLGAYGLAAVEAAVFNEAIFCRLDPDVIEVMERESGLKNPFIQWSSEEELRERAATLCERPKLIRRFGALTNEYCKKMHDEDPVARRFLNVVEAM